MKGNSALKLLINPGIFFIFLLALLPAVTVSAASSAFVSVITPASELSPGQQFTVSISVTPNNAIVGMQLDLSFDPSVAKVNGVAEGNLLNRGDATTYFNAGKINNTTGTITGVFDTITTPGETVSTAGNFAVITMTAGPQGGSCQITLSNLIIGNVQSETIPVNVTSGTVNVVKSSDTSPPPSSGTSVAGAASSGTGVGPAVFASLSESVNSEGLLSQDVSAMDINMKVELLISKGTAVRNSNGQIATGIGISAQGESPAPAPGSLMIGQVFNIEQTGTTFDIPATLIFRYDSPEIPQGIPENNLYVAQWDPAALTWVDLGGTIDTNARTVSVPITHLSAYALMAHSRPASFTLSNFELAPGEVSLGDVVTASIDVLNDGDLPGTYEAGLVINGTTVQTRTIKLAGGGGETVTFVVTPDVVGEYQVSIGSNLGKFTVKEPLSPAVFTVSDLKVAPLLAVSGENIEISACIRNTGDVTGTYQATLTIDDISVETRELVLGGGSSNTVIFNFTSDVVGQHKISIGGLFAPFEVKSPLVLPPPTTVNTASRPEIYSFSVAPVFNQATGKLVYARIVYRINRTWDSSSDIKVVLAIYHDGLYVEDTLLFTLSQLQPDGTGELDYIPPAGWKIGKYAFRAGLYEGENLVEDTPLQSITVTPEATTSVFTWKILAIIVGGACVLGAIITAIVIYRRREMLHHYWKK